MTKENFLARFKPISLKKKLNERNNMYSNLFFNVIDYK